MSLVLLVSTICPISGFELLDFSDQQLESLFIKSSTVLFMIHVSFLETKIVCMFTKTRPCVRRTFLLLLLQGYVPILGCDLGCTKNGGERER